jgi:hypothetical protein
MAWSPEDSLVIGISSRALFNLDEEDRIFREDGTLAFIDYERSHESDLPQPGVAFPLIEALLNLNGKLPTSGHPAIEIIIISKNHPDCGIRIRRSLKSETAREAQQGWASSWEIGCSHAKLNRDRLRKQWQQEKQSQAPAVERKSHD